MRVRGGRPENAPFQDFIGTSMGDSNPSKGDEAAQGGQVIQALFFGSDGALTR
jgi:hypothetical protein